MRDFADLSLTRMVFRGQLSPARSKPCLVAVVVFSSYLAISLTFFAQLQDDGAYILEQRRRRRCGTVELARLPTRQSARRMMVPSLNPSMAALGGATDQCTTPTQANRRQLRLGPKALWMLSAGVRWMLLPTAVWVCASVVTTTLLGFVLPADAYKNAGGFTTLKL